MPLIIPPGFLQAAYHLRLDGDSEDMVVTMGHDIDTASGASLADAADDLHLAFGNNLVAGLLPAAYTLDHVVTYGGNDGPTIVGISTEAPIPGTGSGAVLPPNCAYLVRKRTDLGGRRGRGRFYLPGVPESAVDNVGVISGAQLAFVQEKVDDWYDFLTIAQGARYYPPVVLHRSEGIGAEPPPTPVAALSVDSKIATQRRRLRP